MTDAMVRMEKTFKEPLADINRQLQKGERQGQPSVGAYRRRNSSALLHALLELRRKQAKQTPIG